MKVLFICYGLLGDLISYLVCPSHLARQGHSVSCLVRPAFTTLLEGEIVSACLEQDLEKSYDLIIDADTSKKTASLVKSLQAPKKLGVKGGRGAKRFFRSPYSDLVDITSPFHAFMGHAFLRALGYTDFIKTPVLSHKDPQIMQEFKQKFAPKHIIAIHIGASVKERYLPEYFVLKLIDLARQNNLAVVLVGTEKDRAQKFEALSQYYAKHIQTSLSELKSILSACLFVIGTDSSIVHLSHALDLVVMGVYGQQLAKSVVPSLEPSDRFFALEPSQKLACRPCGFDKRCKNVPYLAYLDFAPEVIEDYFNRLLRVSL